jgi:glucosyl-3-phosphoglycerate synthase
VRTFHHGEFPPERLARERTATVSVCLPAREEAETIGGIVASLIELRELGVVDQVVVIDASSSDGTADIGARYGAEVHQQEDLLRQFGPVLGKGDAMWRALTVLRGEVVCFLDADSADFGAHFACGVLGPLLCHEGVEYVKAFYRRPFTAFGAESDEGGGRVTELTARPLLNLFYPELATVRQPLAGEVGARRSLLERLPYVVGYGVEIAQLIDACREVGPAAIAQVDLDVRRNRHQPLRDLGPMAYAVLRAVAERLAREERLDGWVLDDAARFVVPADGGEVDERAVPVIERPPMASVRAPV